MIFHETALHGLWLIEPERIADERGFFARVYCENEFRAHGIEFRMVQANVSYNHHSGTLRGMHFQAEPHGEAKLIRCISGSLYDVIIDLVPTSPTFRLWTAIELSAANRLSLYVPPGMAHGFQTLTDDTEVLYQMGEFYYPELARGLRYDDPAFKINWPLPISVISERDQSYANWD